MKSNFLLRIQAVTYIMESFFQTEKERNRMREENREERVIPSVDILYDMIQAGIRHGYIRYKIKETPDIPDLSMLSEDVCEELFRRTAEYSKDHPQVSPANTAPSLCFYAGMGAVKLWTLDSARLLGRGIVNMLTGERGFERMDEYVLDLTGFSYGSSASENLMRQISEIETVGLESMPKQQSDEVFYRQFLEFMKAMYLYGMVLEMDRLGLKGAGR